MRGSRVSARSARSVGRTRWQHDPLIPEPTIVTPESAFEAAVITAVREILAEAGRDHLLVPRFGLDVAVFIESPDGVKVRLVEVEVFAAQRPGGVGFGNGRGEGPQVELLSCSPSSMLLLAPAVRWILADARSRSPPPPLPGSGGARDGGNAMSRVLGRRGEHEAARLLLGGICSRFTEGLDSADLREARTLLEAPG